MPEYTASAVNTGGERARPGGKGLVSVPGKTRSVIDLRRLRYFIAVAEELNFGRAALRVGIEQPPLSESIRELEEELGVRLFNRTTRHTHLTVPGAAFLLDARAVFAAVNRALHRLNAFAEGHQGHLAVSISRGLASERLSRLVRTFCAAEPQIAVQILELALPEMLQHLEMGLVDAAFFLGPLDEPALRTERLWREPCVAVLEASHPLKDLPHVSLTQLTRESLILRQACARPGIKTRLHQLVQDTHPQARISQAQVSLDLLLTLVGAGLGVGITHASQANGLRRPDVVIRPLAERSIELEVALLIRDEEPAAPLAKLIEQAKRMR